MTFMLPQFIASIGKTFTSTIDSILYEKAQEKFDDQSQNTFHDILKDSFLYDGIVYSWQEYRKAVCGKPHVRFDEGAVAIPLLNSIKGGEVRRAEKARNMGFLGLEQSS